MKTKLLLSILICWLSVHAAHAQSPAPLLFHSATISGEHVAFSYAGDIWLVERAGGNARRITTTAGREINPLFSPDGSQLAFSRFNPANGPFGWDVYVVKIDPARVTGDERRITYHPDLDLAINWTADGRNILLMSFRARSSLLGGGFYSVPASGGYPVPLPIPRGWAGSLSADGDHIAYTPLVKASEVVSWRNYRGGGTSKIWVVRLSDGSFETIPRTNSNDTDPMWIGNKIYFLSDRDGTENLFSYDTSTKAVLQLTRYVKYGIKSATANGSSIVFVRDGSIYVFDTKTNRADRVDVRVPGDFHEVKVRKIDGGQWLNSVGLSPDARELVLGVRGEIFTANTADGTLTNITGTGSAVERNAIWSPDGKAIAYFSDESGEQQLFVRTVRDGALRRINIETKPSFYSELQWSPDSKQLVFSDSRRALWHVDLGTGAARRLDSAAYTDGGTSLQPFWSPDGRWLAYSKFGVNRVRSIAIYSLETHKAQTITSPQIDAQQPVFDNNGRYLYFIGSNRTGLVESQGMSGFPFRTQVTRSLYVVVLNTSDPSPLVQNAAANSSMTRVAIDFTNISDRTLPIPFWPANGNRVMPGKPGVLFIVEGGTLHKFVSGKPGLEKFVEGAGLYRINNDGSRLLLRRQGNWAIVSTDAPPKPDDGRFKLNSLELTIEPRAEWRQMYEEAWRRMRDYFYDPNLHGQNLTELKSHYAAYLPNIATREDLNTLFKEMFSHLSASHMAVSGGDMGGAPDGVADNLGLLGADFEIENGRYRIKRILRGDHWRGIVSPLLRPGINVRTGEYLIAVDGEEIKGQESLYRYFVNKAGKPVELKIASAPDGLRARVVTVVPLATEYHLRQNDWAENNRRRVDELSGGKLAYIFLPDTSDAGYNAFNREFYAQLDKHGIVIDGRFNEGGRAADYIIDTLRRVPLQRARLRDAEDIRIPTGILEGPKVLLTNEMAGSGGDTLPWMWQQTKLGPVVGFRTAGAGVGATAHQLVDGGNFQVPDWGWYDARTGTWLMENRGVTPDLQLEITPREWRAGRDIQLDKAVQLALEALRRNPPSIPKPPKYPVYK